MNKTVLNLVVRIVMVALMSSTLLFINCPVPDNSDSDSGGGASITITNVGWVIENIDGSFFSTPPSSTCFYDWFVSYTGDSISLSDISTARMYSVDEGVPWDLIYDSAFFDGANKRIGGWGRWYWGSNDHKVPIGNFRAEIVLTNGHTTTYDVVFPAPGSKSTDGKKYVYTKDYTGSTNGYYTPMIKRATLTNDSKTTSPNEITIEFDVDDPLVYSGYVTFYDSSGDYVGTTGYFRNYETGALNTDLLSNLYRNGTSNTLNISDSEITYVTGKSFSDISKFIVILTDGGQYAGESATYDCLSRSVQTSF